MITYKSLFGRPDLEKQNILTYNLHKLVKKRWTLTG